MSLWRSSRWLMLLLVLSNVACHRQLPIWQALNSHESLTLVDQGDIEELKVALDYQLQYLERQLQKNPEAVFDIGSRQLKLSELNSNYQALRKFLETNPMPPQVVDWIGQQYDYWRYNPRRNSEHESRLLVTSYYVPEFSASRLRDERFQVPLYPAPDDLASRQPYFTRAQIDYEGALEGKIEPIAWLEHQIDKVILQIQGSGRLIFPDGSQVTVGYAANNGYPYVALGKLLLRDGVLAPEQRNMPAIRQYFIDHPDELKRYAEETPRYIFFTFHERAVGSLGLPVVAQRTIAVDPQRIPLGLLAYLETSQPILSPEHRYQGTQPLKLLVFSHDTGGGIIDDHIDLFWGYGDLAGEYAGRMKQSGQLYLLIPKTALLPKVLGMQN